MTTTTKRKKDNEGMKPEQPMAPVQMALFQSADRADFRRDRYEGGRTGFADS